MARAVKASPRLRLRGVECFEGIVLSPDATADREKVQGWLDAVAAVARRCEEEDLFETDEVLLTAIAQNLRRLAKLLCRPPPAPVPCSA